MQTKDNIEIGGTRGIRVFVYGTLKQGHCNNPALENGKFLGRCYVEGRHKFYDLGWYPAIVDNSEGDDSTMKVFGEVYLIDEDTLFTLDCIEGHPDYYKRRKVQTPWKNAWAYFLPSSYNDRDLELIEGGIWEPTEEEEEFARGTENAA